MTGDLDPVGRRRAELVTNLGSVRARIAAACARSGRDPREVTLVAVTKTWPAADVATLATLGVLDVGENKDQEARAKIAELTRTAPQPTVPATLRWHLVGQLQTNKARSVAGYAAAVHSVDRAKLVRVLADAADAAEGSETGRPDATLDVFVQVSLDGDPRRGGAAVQAVPELADLVADRPQLRLRGVMAVPPIVGDAGDAYARLAEISRAVQADHPGAADMSAGMSADFEVAIEHGATYVRVGTALLGRRDPIVG